MLPYQLPFRLTDPAPSVIIRFIFSPKFENIEPRERSVTGRAGKLIRLAPIDKSMLRVMQSLNSLSSQTPHSSYTA
jgi:hypothetical protein